ncbi:MAG: CoA transferase, partial [Burkholderiales bacterium]|nr:CoA transferase [Burkholderiales bacterium]
IALGAMAALRRRATEGGSWHVRISLAQTGHWLRSLGQNPAGLDCHDPDYEDVQAFMETHDSALGHVRTVRHAAQLAATPAYWSRPAVALGSDAASW